MDSNKAVIINPVLLSTVYSKNVGVRSHFYGEIIIYATLKLTEKHVIPFLIHNKSVGEFDQCLVVIQLLEVIRLHFLIKTCGHGIVPKQDFLSLSKRYAPYHALTENYKIW